MTIAITPKEAISAEKRVKTEKWNEILATIPHVIQKFNSRLETGVRKINVPQLKRKIWRPSATERAVCTFANYVSGPSDKTQIAKVIDNVINIYREKGWVVFITREVINDLNEDGEHIDTAYTFHFTAPETVV